MNNLFYRPNTRYVSILTCSAALLALILGVSSFNITAAAQETKRVFVLDSFNRGYSWTDNMLRGVDDAFGNSGIKVETYVTFMDMKRVPPSPEYFLQLKELIRTSYQGVHFDAVLVCDNDALEFARKYRDELFPGVPIVFASINDFNVQMLDGRKDITGTSENTDYSGTIELALKLRPATKNIVVVVDATTTGKAHRSAVEKIRPNFPANITFTYLSLADMTIDELSQKLDNLSSDSIVLLLQHFVDKNGLSHTVQESTPVLTANMSVPVFVVTDIRIGLGALGGHVVSGYAHGEAAAEMVVKILTGTDVSSIPVLLDSQNKYMFDYNVMQHFNVAENDLPAGSIVINKPATALDKYRNEIYTILAVFIILCGILVYLLFEIRKRHKIEQTLKLTRISVEAASDALFWMTPDARIVDVNEAACRALGYTRQELLKLRVPDVDTHFSDEVWQNHFPALRELGTLTFETEHRARDGRVFPVEIVANYIKFGSEERNCAFVRDISERKRINKELIANKEMLKNILDNTRIHLWAFNGTEYIYTNKEWFTYTGQDPASTLTIERWLSVIHPDDQASYAAIWAKNWEAKTEHDNYFRLKRYDGVFRYFFCHSVPVFNDQGDFQYFQGINIDITERKLADDALRAASLYSRNLIETSLDPLVTISPEGKITDVNTATEKVTGQSRARLIGSDFTNYFTEPEMARAGYLKAFELGQVIDYPLAILHSSGTLTDVLYNASVYRNEQAEVIGVFAAARDITARKQAEEALRESEDKFKYLFDYSVIGKSITYLDGKVDVNKSFVNMLGYSQQEMQDKKWRELTHPDDIELTQNEIDKLISGETKSARFIKRFIHKNGSTIWVDLSSTIRRDQNNKPLYLMSALIDISARKQAEDEIRRLNAELEQRVIMRTAQLEASNKELEAFAYSVSHDLRAPLRAMEGFSSALLSHHSEQLNELGKHYLDRIQQASQRMGQLINDLLKLSRITRSELSRQRVDLSLLTGEIAAELKTREPERQVEFVIAEHLIVQGDAQLLRIALQNLLDNAWKFSSTRPVAIIELGRTSLAKLNYRNGTDGDSKITPSESPTLNHLINPVDQTGITMQSEIYFVRDNGVGFDLAFTGKLFAPFQRLHAIDEFPGTGIGLAIVQRIINRHGGLIWPNAQVNQGATFYFTLGEPA